MKVTPELPQGPNVINRFEGEYHFLSNFHPVAIRYRGAMYPTVEHAYQAAKFHNPEHRAEIQFQSSPSEAKRRSKMMEKYWRDDWAASRLRIMAALCWVKFHDTSLRAKLEATGKRLLIEGNDWGDKFWGVANGEGENHLGRILMTVRLRNRYEHWAMAESRYITTQLVYDPWNACYTVRSVQRDWEAFARGALHGHLFDYRVLQG